MNRKHVAATCLALLAWGMIAAASSSPAQQAVAVPSVMAPSASPMPSFQFGLGNQIRITEDSTKQECPDYSRAEAAAITGVAMAVVKRVAFDSGQTASCGYSSVNGATIGVLREVFPSPKKAQQVFTSSLAVERRLTVSGSPSPQRVRRLGNAPAAYLVCRGRDAGHATVVRGTVLVTVFVDGARSKGFCGKPLTALALRLAAA
jgi:hypothetical protein